MRLLRLFLPIIIGFALLSCSKERPLIRQGGGAELRIPLELSCEPLPTETGEVDITRSSHPATALTTVSNVNYYLFRNGALAKQEYFSNAANFFVTLPDGEATYNLYLLANVGQKTLPSSTAESAIGTALCVDYGSRSNYFSTIQSSGFPMSNVITGFNSSSGARYTLKRLVHTLYVTMNTDELSATSMNFTGVQIKQAPRNVYPFATGGSKATAVMDGDAANLSASDIERLNAGETVTLYLLENMRGTLIPGNTSWKTKVPSRISSTSDRSLASYIEITAEVQTPTALYENNIYRAYLGTTAYDFDVERSTYFLLNNNFTNDMVVDEDWRIEGDEPTVNSQLCFADTRFTYETAYDGYKTGPNSTSDNEYRPFKEVSSFYTMKGFTAVYYIYRSNPDIDYTLTVDKGSGVEPYVSYRRSRLDDNFEAIMINTNQPVSTNSYYFSEGGWAQNFPTKDVVFTLRSADGLITKTFTTKVLYNSLGVKFHYDNVGLAVATNDDGILNMYMTNPLNLRVRVSIAGTVYGYVSYKPNGTVFGSKSQSPEISIRTGGLYNVTGGAVRMDTYQNNTDLGGEYQERDGFYQYFKSIWNTTGWDSYTKLNGSNGYHKHAHPTKLRFGVTMTFDSPNSRRLKPESGMVLPVYFVNGEFQQNSDGVGYGAGTDWGFEWDHFDKEGSSSYDRYRFLRHIDTPNKSLYNYDNEVPINVSINGTNKWRTNNPGIPVASSYSDTYFSDLGF